MPPSPGLTFFCPTESMVIALGGGFMGWVDLSQAILLCDVLAGNPEVHYIALTPQPAEAVKSQQLTGPNARAYRDIAVVQGYIKFVVHQTHIRPWSFSNGTYVSDDWTATTYRWKINLGCYWQGQWEEVCRCNASEITGSLGKMLGNKEAESLPPLQRLHTGLPTISLDEDDVV
ncbi:hypothetical protein ACP4OV_023654 [Aristida adscensionis]